MRVQRVVMPGTSAESWTVFDDDCVPVVAAERYLRRCSVVAVWVRWAPWTKHGAARRQSTWQDGAGRRRSAFCFSQGRSHDSWRRCAVEWRVIFRVIPRGGDRGMPGTGGDRVSKGEMSVVMILLTFATAVRLPTLGQRLVEAHAFRQTQTAFTARIYHESGIDLLHPELPVLGEPWEVPFEFPLFQAMSTFPMNLGASTDVSVRVTALTCFLATAALLWVLVRYVTRSPFASVATVVVFCFSPFALLWSRSSLIEYLATAGGVGFAAFGIMWWDRRTVRLGMLAAACAVLSILVKLTTGVFWILPVIGWALQHPKCEQHGTHIAIKSRLRAVCNGGLAAIILPGLLAGLVWTRHADHIKGATESTRWLTSSALMSWNLGTLDQRLSFENWTVVFSRLYNLIVGGYVGIALMVAALVLIKKPGFWWAVACGTVLPIMVFFSLYVAHDYYLAAVSPAVAIIIGGGVGIVANKFKSSRMCTLGPILIITGWLIFALVPTAPYWLTAYRETDPRTKGLILADELASHTNPRDRIVVLGLDWEPTWLYYAERRGTMLVHDQEQRSGRPAVKILSELRQRGYKVFAANDPVNNPLEAAMVWPWIAPVSPHVYRVGESPQELGRAAVLGSTDESAFVDIARDGEAVTDTNNNRSVPRRS